MPTYPFDGPFSARDAAGEDRPPVGEAAEIFGQQRRGRVSPLRVLFQRPQADRLQIKRDARVQAAVQIAVMICWRVSPSNGLRRVSDSYSVTPSE